MDKFSHGWQRTTTLSHYVRIGHTSTGDQGQGDEKNLAEI